MTYGGEFLKFTFLYTITGTDEVADTSICYSTLIPSTGWASAALGEITNTVLNNMVGDMATLMAIASWADYSRLVGIKAAAISTAGEYLTEAKVSTGTTVVAGTNSQVLPQSTIVVSLRSGFTLGKGNFGRMYLPHSRMDIATGFPITGSTTRDAVCLGAKNFINSLTGRINAVTTAIVEPAIMSQAAGHPAKGVTQVRVGGVNDTQRRRRNQLTEVYSIQELA